MLNTYGVNRVIEPAGAVPTSAWKLDNSREIEHDEMRIALKKIHIEGSSFRQISMEAAGNDDAIRQKITDIVIRRGKLHNPVTDTGGLILGVVEEIGPDYINEKNLKPGDEIICNASLASVPTQINSVGKIDRALSQVEASGHSILYNGIPVVKKPTDVPDDLLLFIFNESGTLYRVSSYAAGKRTFLVVGNNLMMNILYGHTIRKAAGPEARIICIRDKKSNVKLEGSNIDALVRKTFDEIVYANIMRPVACMEKLGNVDYFDMSVNCTEMSGSEVLNILATKYGGTVIFASLINNYNSALYVTESISKHLNIRNADGYLEEYDEFDLELIKDLAPYFEGVTIREEEYMPPKTTHHETPELLVEEFVSESDYMNGVIDEVLSVAKYDCNVLISGETGSGKEKIANIIQKNSSRRMQPFVKINCASIAPSLMESEFFGYEKGAFTGAKDSGKKGFFEIADNGIVFLDEVGDLPLDMQAKLLRVIQDGEFFRVGGSLPVKTNVRILSATNKNLEDMVESKNFRRDLYYRLNVFPIKVPSLDSRREDIGPLTDFFIKKYGEKFGIERTIEDDAEEYLVRHNWPGNIRELENVVQRLLIGAKGKSITLMDVTRELHGEIFEHTDIKRPEVTGEDINLEAMVESYEKQIIKHALEKHGTTRKAASAIGISQTQLVRKKNRYEI